MNKKAIAILGAIFLLIVGTLGFLIYSNYYAKKTPAATLNTNNPNTAAVAASPTPTLAVTPTPTPGTLTAQKLIDDQVVSPVLFYNGNGITYFNKQGQLFQATIQDSGSQVLVSAKKQLDIPVKANISRILWPSKGDNFIAEININGKKSWSFFDSYNKVYSDLPAAFGSLDWMPTADKIYYTWTYADPNKHDTVNLSDPDGKNYQKVGEIWDKDAIVSVSPDGLNVLYYRDNVSDAINPIVLTSPDGKVWRTLVKDGFNYGVLWSPDGKKFLFGKKNPSSGAFQLWYYDLYSGEVKNLGLFTTTDKAVWSKDSTTIYAAVPSSPSLNPGALSTDSFFKFNTGTFDKTQYNFSGQSLDGRNLFLNSSENKLFFKNAQDGGLYYFGL